MKISLYEEIPSYGDVYTIEHWIGNVEIKGFIDYDGFGNLATKDKVTDIMVKPSFVKDGKIVKAMKSFRPETMEPIDEDFLKKNNLTHIVWYNR
jgi:hypothetical protein